MSSNAAGAVGLLAGFRKIKVGAPGRMDVKPHFCDDHLRVEGESTVCEWCGQTFVEDLEVASSLDGDTCSAGENQAVEFEESRCVRHDTASIVV